MTIRIVGSNESHVTGSDVTGTGSDVTGTGSDGKGGGHVIWNGKPLTSGEKGSRAQMKKRDADMTCPLARVGNHWPVGKKGSRLQGGEKPQRERRLRVQSPIRASGGWSFTENNTGKCHGTYFIGFSFLFLTTSGKKRIQNRTPDGGPFTRSLNRFSCVE